MCLSPSESVLLEVSSVSLRHDTTLFPLQPLLMEEQHQQYIE